MTHGCLGASCVCVCVCVYACVILFSLVTTTRFRKLLRGALMSFPREVRAGRISLLVGNSKLLSLLVRRYSATFH